MLLLLLEKKFIEIFFKYFQPNSSINNHILSLFYYFFSTLYTIKALLCPSAILQFLACLYSSLQLLGLLKIVLDMQKSRGSDKHRRATFDPKSALFVCNRVDLVDKRELDRVKQNAIGIIFCYQCLSLPSSQFTFYAFKPASLLVFVFIHARPTS